MRRKSPTAALAHLPGAAVLHLRQGETIHIGDAIQVNAAQTEHGGTVLSIWAPRNLSIDRAKNFRAQNNDGPGVSAPEPSAP